jgi:uncharacterized protein YndB with AHSA1/START domain
MRTCEIRHHVGIKAPAAVVYQALTDREKLAGWWTSDTRGVSEVGGELEFWFGNFCQKFHVTALEPGQRVRWQAQAGGMGEWTGTEVSFELNEADGQTSVDFIHAGWADNAKFFPHCSTKWAVFMLSLKDLVEMGTGHPAPNDVQIS